MLGWCRLITGFQSRPCACCQPLKLKHDKQLSNVAFKFNLRPSTKQHAPLYDPGVPDTTYVVMSSHCSAVVGVSPRVRRALCGDAVVDHDTYAICNLYVIVKHNTDITIALIMRLLVRDMCTFQGE